MAHAEGDRFCADRLIRWECLCVHHSICGCAKNRDSTFLLGVYYHRSMLWKSDAVFTVSTVSS